MLHGIDCLQQERPHGKGNVRIQDFVRGNAVQGPAFAVELAWFRVGLVVCLAGVSRNLNRLSDDV